MTMDNTLSNCMERIVVFSEVTFRNQLPSPRRGLPAPIYWCNSAIGCEITG